MNTAIHHQNKTGHIVNFAFQTLGVLVFLALLLSGIMQGGITDFDGGAFFGILLTQLVFGFYQLIAGIVNIATIRNWNKRIKRMYQVYWILVGLYAVGSAAGITYINQNNSTGEEMAYIFLSAWFIAIFQYVIVIMQAFGRNRRFENGDPFYQGHYPVA